MNRSPNDTTWARAWLPPCFTAMVDAQFADAPPGIADELPQPWPPVSLLRLDAGMSACDARPVPTAWVSVLEALRRALSGRRFDKQRSVRP